MNQTAVAVVPNNEFFQGDIGNQFARFSFAKKDHVL